MVFDRWMAARTIKFGPWKAFRASRELVGPTGTKVLEPEVMELLFLLHANADEGLWRDDIFKRLWPRGGATTDALARGVSQLREALGDDPLAPRYITTQPERGVGTAPVDPDFVVMRVPARPWIVALGGVVIVGAFFWFLVRGFD